MNKHDDFLVELHTEELPPKSLEKLGRVFAQQIKERLQKMELTFDDVTFFATPRRLAVLVKQLMAAQSDQMVERKGPALSAAFDAQGQPTPACIGFARSCGVEPDALMKIKNEQGEWVGFKQIVPGKSVVDILPTIVEQAATALPIPKRMRWGDNDAQFTRPIHSVIMLYGQTVVKGTILGFVASRETRGHRFHAPGWIEISSAAAYEKELEKVYVIADFAKRREKIYQESLALVREKLGPSILFPIKDSDLLDEVTGLVEWPVPLLGNFDEKFLAVPQEVLISAMQDHQRYFPVFSNNEISTQHPLKKLLPHFVAISNIESLDANRVIHGNERVLRARLSDAAFFFETDKKESLEERVERLKGIIFQAKLGTLHDKVERISKIATFIAEKMGANTAQAARAGWLAKADLTSNMVGEFPELQGVMGYYYALHDGESNDVAQAMTEQYMPRFAGDVLPQHDVGQALALADRIDTLIATFGINQIPTGDKDPYGLRRAALGILRILIESKINLDLREVLEFALTCYQIKLENEKTTSQVLSFIQERLRAWYLDQGITTDVFAAVAATGISNPLDAHERIKAVQAFKKLNEAETLSIANKRVSNILAKTNAIATIEINAALFENPAETALAQQLEIKRQAVVRLYETGQYDQVLLQLAELRKPIDDFFDHVMVMTDDEARRNNRLLLLKKLRALFLQVADIALLDIY